MKHIVIMLVTDFNYQPNLIFVEQAGAINAIKHFHHISKLKHLSPCKQNHHNQIFRESLEAHLCVPT